MLTMQVVESRGRAVDFYSAFETPGWCRDSPSSPLDGLRWLWEPGTSRETACVRIVSNGQKARHLPHHSITSRGEIIS